MPACACINAFLSQTWFKAHLKLIGLSIN